MSAYETRKELESVIHSGSYKVIPEVYEYRYVKLSVTIDDAKRELWVFMGKERDYLMIPGLFCSCKDFMIRTVINKTSKYCKHQLGLYISMNRGKYIEIAVDPERFIKMLLEIVEKKFSIELRRSLPR